MNKLFKNIVLSGILISSSFYPYWIQNPYNLEKWLKNNFTYQSEETDYWKTPKETLKDKGGDCEDFAIFNKYILKDLGYKAHLIILTKDEDKTAHAICVFIEKDHTFSAFDNTTYVNAFENSLKALMYKHYKRWDNVYSATENQKYQLLFKIKHEK